MKAHVIRIGAFLVGAVAIGTAFLFGTTGLLVGAAMAAAGLSWAGELYWQRHATPDQKITDLQDRARNPFG